MLLPDEARRPLNHLASQIYRAEMACGRAIEGPASARTLWT